MFTDEERKKRAFLRAAKILYELWEETRHIPGGQFNTRILDKPLIPREYVTYGSSGPGAIHHEHVVPLKVIRDESFKLFEGGKTIDDIAKLMEKNLKIVLISKAEQLRVDKEFKTEMPSHWSYENGDPFARLEKAGIKIIPL